MLYQGGSQGQSCPQNCANTFHVGGCSEAVMGTDYQLDAKTVH